MAQILVDELPESLVQQLKARAERNGRSLEAEVREILGRAVAGDRKGFYEARRSHAGTVGRA